MNDSADAGGRRGGTPGGREPVSADVAAVLCSWRPRGLDAEDAALAEVLPRARAWVAAAAPETAETARALLRATTRLALWARREIGSVEPAVVLHPHNVQHFVAYVCAGERQGWRHAARWALVRVGRAANPRGWAPALPKIGRANCPEPYSGDDERAFAVAAALPGRADRAARLWVVCAALGAGLLGSEITDASTDDVTGLAGGRLAVRVRGRNPRLVPLRRAYTCVAQQAMQAAVRGAFLSCEGPNAANRAARRIAVSGEMLSLRRARNTWLAAHLRAGTPLWALRCIAGPVSASTLDALLSHVVAGAVGGDAASEGLRA